MKVDESRNSRSRLTANSHQLSCTLINFELVQILMTVNERFGSFDRRRELQKQAISKSLPIRRRRKKRIGEATSKNKEIEKRRKTLVNSHATLTARLTEQ